jgi:hypothetical protein
MLYLNHLPFTTRAKVRLKMLITVNFEMIFV